MAKPQHKTCLSILRTLLGPGAGNEEYFAKKIGRSVSWLKKASCGQIPLTEDAAIRISYETGISVPWLFKGDTTKEPVDIDGKPFTKKSYELYNLQRGEGIDEIDASESLEEVIGLLISLITTYACARDNNLGGYFSYRLGLLSEQVAREFENQKMKDQSAYEKLRAEIPQAILELNETAFAQAPKIPKKKAQKTP